MHAICVLGIAMLTTFTNAQSYHGILINGAVGTQLYNPFKLSPAQGNLQLGLPAGSGGAAAINGELAYFASGNILGGMLW